MHRTGQRGLGESEGAKAGDVRERKRYRGGMDDCARAAHRIRISTRGSSWRARVAEAAGSCRLRPAGRWTAWSIAQRDEPASSRRSDKGARSTLRRCVEHAPTRARSDAPTLFRAPSPSLLRPGDGAGAGTHDADPGRCLVSTLGKGCTLQRCSHPGRCLVSTLGKGCTRSDAVTARGLDGMERCAPRLDSYSCLINRVRYKSKFVSNSSTLPVRDDPGQPGAALRQLRALGRGATAPAVD
jgi:hypothetical protein